MIKMNADEIKAHQKEIDRLAAKKTRIRGKFLDGQITKSVYSAKLEEVDVEQTAFIKKSKVILFYGRHYRAEA